MSKSHRRHPQPITAIVDLQPPVGRPGPQFSDLELLALRSAHFHMRHALAIVNNSCGMSIRWAIELSAIALNELLDVTHSIAEQSGHDGPTEITESLSMAVRRGREIWGQGGVLDIDESTPPMRPSKR